MEEEFAKDKQNDGSVSVMNTSLQHLKYYKFTSQASFWALKFHASSSTNQIVFILAYFLNPKTYHNICTIKR